MIFQGSKDRKMYSAMEKVMLARDASRPKITDYIENLFTDFFEQKGDMLGKEDGSIYGGIALFHGRPVTVLGHRKGKNLEENLTCNFGMPGPEGYRKALRMMEQAERFNRPVITFIDTPGAYPGVEAEEFGQSQAIADNLARMSSLTVPVISIVTGVIVYSVLIISIVTGEGSSGGALAIGVANRVFMLENAIYSILSPEGFATILWKDSARKAEASEIMKLTAQDLQELGVIDGIIEETDLYANLDNLLTRELKVLENKSGTELERMRYKKFRRIDERFLTLGGNR